VGGDVAGEGDVLVDRVPGPPVHRQGGRHDGALERRTAIALVLDGREPEGAALAVGADVAVAEVHAGRADLPVVVDRLHHRDPELVRSTYHRGRQQRVRVVQVHDVRLLSTQHSSQRAGG